VADPRESYTDPRIADILNASEAIAERVYEVNPSVPPHLQAACRAVAEAVYEWHERLDLQDELAGEGVRAGAVSDLGDSTYAASYAATVQRVLQASDQLHRMTIRESEGGLPYSADPLIEGLGKALTQWDRQTVLASSWQREGGRPEVLRSTSASTPPPDPPDAPPPGSGRSAASEDSSPEETSRPLESALVGGNDGDTAARAAPGVASGAAADAVGSAGTRADATPPLPDEGARPLRDEGERRQRDRAREAAQHARQRGAFAR
jgi:hypothetical protein